VIGTNKIQIYVCVDANAGHLIVISALDNLVKGAAGQAVQNMNVLLGWPEEQGLSNLQVLTDNHTL
jgi:N-acetyl-gamma-glutamyl-phosphate reductase